MVLLQSSGSSWGIHLHPVEEIKASLAFCMAAMGLMLMARQPSGGFSFHWTLWTFVQVTTKQGYLSTFPSVLLVNLFSMGLFLKTSGEHLYSTAYLAALPLTIWRHERPFSVLAFVTFPLQIWLPQIHHIQFLLHPSEWVTVFILFNHVDRD